VTRRNTIATDAEKPTIHIRFLSSPPKGVTGRHLSAAVKAAMADHPFRNISIALVDDDTMASLHERFLGDGRSTDVITFDLRDNPEDPMLEGEIVISTDTARRQARKYRTSEADELLRYAVHGALHLQGHDDRNTIQRRRMKKEEDRILATLRAVLWIPRSSISHGGKGLGSR